MPTRREILRLIPASVLLTTARASMAKANAQEKGKVQEDDENAPDFGRFDTHIHIHQDAPLIIADLKKANWRGLDIVVCPTLADEPFDLEEKLRVTLKVHRDSDGVLAWASTFDARGFESPDFTERTIALLRQTFADEAIGVKIWKNIGMAIKDKSGEYLLPDHPALLPIYETIQKEDRTLIAHLAEPDGAWLPLDEKNPEIRYYSNNPQWHMYGREKAPDKAAILTARDRVLARYPKLRVVGCHLGSDEDDLSRLAKRLDAYPNFAVDTAARVRYFAAGDRDQVRAFLDRYQDRIIYATDYSLRDNDSTAASRGLQSTHDTDWKFFSTDEKMEYAGRPSQGLALSDKILRKLFRENALRWLPGLQA